MGPGLREVSLQLPLFPQGHLEWPCLRKLDIAMLAALDERLQPCVAPNLGSLPALTSLSIGMPPRWQAGPPACEIAAACSSL